jgi:hypothetical protein
MSLLQWLKGKALAAALAVVLLGAGTRTYADSLITIVPTYDASITGDPNAAAIEGTIQSAINYYQSTFTTRFAPLTVNITFQEGGGLGSSSVPVGFVFYSDYLAQLTAASSGDSTDTTALAHLPATVLNPVTGTPFVAIKIANARALGFVTPIGNDGTITLNTSLTTPGSPGAFPFFSLFSVTEHEIDEVLGLGSAIDFATSPLPEDLYRYDNMGNRTFTDNPSVQAFFSLDGTTQIAQFDNQNDGGDFGDWQSNPPPAGAPVRVQDAFATPFSNPTLANDGGAEVIALDSIGYNLAPQVTPEPASVVLLGLGLLLGGLGVRRWKKRLQQVA